MQQCSLAVRRFPQKTPDLMSAATKSGGLGASLALRGAASARRPNFYSLTEKSLVSLGTGPVSPLL